MATPTQPAAGTITAGYRDLTLIHTGPVSRVYRAVDEDTGLPVCLKTPAAGAPPHVRAAFEREAALLATLGAHPAVVTPYGSRTVGTRRVLILEPCRSSLQAVRAVSPREAVAIAVKLAGALETLHRAGILHRDVRPANVLISDLGEPVLADFGVARLRADGPVRDELFGFASEHVAPELLMGEPATAATDVYGLAATLYLLLAGHAAVPVPVGDRSATTVLRILRDPVRPLVRAGMPLDLSDLVLWGLTKSPTARPPSALWFAEELGRIESASGWPRTHPVVHEPTEPITAASWR